MQTAAAEFQLDFTYEESTAPALTQAAGTIEKGSCVVLCGSSGCGKSTLLRCLNHLIPEFYDGDLKGFCLLSGKDTARMEIGQAGRCAASVFQDPRSQFFTMNSSAEVAFGLENFGVSQEEIHRRVDLAFETFGLQSLRDRNVFALSSGQRQLTALLAAWALDTELLLLDEPTANLDLHAVSQLHDLMLQLKARGKTMVVSEHRLHYLRGIADEYWLMEGGKILRKYSARELEHLDGQTLRDLGLRCTELSRIPFSRQAPVSPEKQDVFEARNISFRYPGGNQVLDGLSLTAGTGEVIALVGTNGCGKTTFGKAAAGLLKPQSGSFYLNGHMISHRHLSDQGIFIMQEAEFQFFTNSVFHELTYGQKDSPQLRSRIESLLKLTGLWELRNRHPFSLSGGQMQKLVLLMACLSPKPLVILDEPTAGLDYESLRICTRLIEQMKKDRIVCIITHDPELISLACTRCIRLDHGKAVQEIPLSLASDFETVQSWMTAGQPADDAPPAVPHGPRLDPRTKLLVVFIAMTAGIFTDLQLILFVFAAVAAAALYERRYGLILGSGSIMLALTLCYALWPTVGFSFLVHFFPRILLMGSGALLLVGKNEAPRTLAGLRKLHVPEKIIMIFAILFRFFPVLSADLGIMNQSMKTRGLFTGFRRKLSAAGEYLEMLIVPMMFRVIRIAESLSASAETRGIALEGRRSSYLSVSFTAADGIIAGLLGCFTLLGLLL